MTWDQVKYVCSTKLGFPGVFSWWSGFKQDSDVIRSV